MMTTPTQHQDAAIRQPDTAQAAKIAFAGAQHALEIGDHTEAARLLAKWRELSPRVNISREDNQ